MAIEITGLKATTALIINLLVDINEVLYVYDGITYFVLASGDTKLRRGIRASNFVTDITITPTGFNGTENIDWVNIESIVFTI